MADKPPIRPVMQPGDVYTAPPSSWSADAIRHKIQSMSDLDIEMQSKPRPGESVHLDDEGAQSLQDAMRLRMQLPR